MERYTGPIFDADSHIYEDLAVWSSYLPAAYRKDYSLEHKQLPSGQFPLHIGGKPITYGEEYWRADGSVPKPGSLHDWLKALHTGEGDHLWVPIPPDVQSGGKRLEKMDAFNVEASLIFPSEGVTMVPFIKDVKALNALLTAYNSYIRDYWGFDAQNRKYMVGFLHLEDLDWALAELDKLLKLGCRCVLTPCEPAQKRSPADPMFDPFWARLNESGCVLAQHIGQATYLNSLLQEWGEPILPPTTEKSAWDWMNCMGETPVIHTLSSMIYMNLFARFPNLKVVSAENGSEWVPAMLKRMDKMRGMARNGRWPGGQLKERPSEIFKRHVFVVPYPEDNLRRVIDESGSADFLVMGSDYPHAEGVAEPALFFADMENLTAEEMRKTMYENGRRMLPRI